MTLLRPRCGHIFGWLRVPAVPVGTLLVAAAFSLAACSGVGPTTPPLVADDAPSPTVKTATPAQTPTLTATTMPTPTLAPSFADLLALAPDAVVVSNSEPGASASPGESDRIAIRLLETRILRWPSTSVDDPGEQLTIAFRLSVLAPVPMAPDHERARLFLGDDANQLRLDTLPTSFGHETLAPALTELALARDGWTEGWVVFAMPDSLSSMPARLMLRLDAGSPYSASIDVDLAASTPSEDAR